MATGRVSGFRLWRRRLVAVALLVLLLVVGYMVWLRNASWFSVDEIEVKGVTANPEQVDGALQGAAADMTTLHVRDDELRDAVSSFPTVASIKADATLFHRLTITVTERLPVAVAQIGGEQVAVSADGYVLRGVDFDPKQLPALDPGTSQGPRLDEDGTAQAAILGATPDALRERVKSATWDEDRGGVVVDLDGAPELRFGDGSDAADKWAAAAAILADPKFGARPYVDVSVPERAVAGG